MASYVYKNKNSVDPIFEYDGVQYPNIHGSAKNYKGGTLTTKTYSAKDQFKNLKTRYLAMMQSQLAGQQSMSQKEYIENLSIAEFEGMEAMIEQQIVEKYNKVAESASSVIGNYKSGATELSAALRDNDREAAVQALAKLISAFEQYPDAVGLINTMLENPGNAQYTDMQTVIRMKNLINLIADAPGIEKNADKQRYLSSALTGSSESLASLIYIIGNYCEELTDEQIIDKLVDSLKGTKPMPVTTSGLKDKITAKSADISLGSESFLYNGFGSVGEEGVRLINAFSYASVKAYRSGRSDVDLTSYSRSNSILMSACRQIFGNSSWVNYQLYNTFAFNSYKTNDNLDYNFRIIRQNMIASYAEKFLVGFDTGLAQRVLIKDYQAYSILGIISAIAQQGIEKADSDKGFYGSTCSGDIMIISFESVYKVNNEWVGKRRSLYNKARRIAEVKRAIDGIKTTGVLNMANLDKYVKQLGIQGISIFIK